MRFAELKTHLLANGDEVGEEHGIDPFVLDIPVVGRPASSKSDGYPECLKRAGRPRTAT